MDEIPASDGCCRDAPAGGRTSESADGTTKSERGRRNLRDRTPRRFFSEKVRYKRQTLQNMARPLKRWLYSYRENPYPSRTEKMQLAVGSQMTLTQVSNWFANARRRIKNTVQTPNLSWSARIKLYNDHVEGNADLFSVSSDDDSIWNPGPDTDEPQNSTFRSDSEHRLISGELTRDSSALNASEGGHHVSESLKMDPEQHFGLSEDFGSHPKYKQSILQRYLNDTYQHVMPAFVEDAPFTKTRGRRESGSLGSRDYEEMSTSSAASPLNDNHLNVFEDFPEELEMARKRRPADDNGCEEDIYWKEISAALALASLARSKKKT